MCPFTGKSQGDSAKTPACFYARQHGFGLRSGDEQPSGGAVLQGKFGRMFPALPPLRSTDEAMATLGAAMRSEQQENNETIPAGFTYLGQFIDHDITLDTTGLGEQIADPTAVLNFRTPKLDLDCLYGRGPVADPQMYRRLDSDMFEIGLTNTRSFGDPTVPARLPFDLPRGPQGLAIIGDPRNDENLIVAQTHLALLRFHNKIVTDVVKNAPVIRSVFEDARQLVQWHYQWIVLHDFLPRLTTENVIDNVLKEGRKFYCFEKASAYKEPFMPLEFSVAAYRLGHSMVRERYDYNRVFGFDPGARTPATLDLLFRFSGLSSSQPQEQFTQDIPIPSDWIIDWRRFYEIEGKPTNISLRLDPFLTPRLHALNNIPAGEAASLAVRNLQRALKMGLPSAQDVAAYMGIALIKEADLTSGDDGKVLKDLGLHLKTPLWYYILKEAQITGGGKHLGPLGAQIVAEVFVGMLEGDPNSYLSRQPSWKPTLNPSGKFTMADLLKFAGDLNPIGDKPAQT